MNDTPLTAYLAPRLFDGDVWHQNAALVVDGSRIAGIGPVPPGAEIVRLEGGIIAPGFVDLQVNGGGGHLVGPGTTADDLAFVCRTHAGFGATSILPTLITDTDAVTDAVLAAGAAAARRNVPGFLGLHLEGPHLAIARKGAHDAARIRPMTNADIERCANARRTLPHLLVTVAAETVTPEQIARLVAAGIVVSLGHSDATYDVATAAFRAGASMATHLFNAMSQLGHRNPGLVGAALDQPHVAAGIIADGIHVHPASFRLALAAKRAPGRIVLVSDSMSQAGTELTEFTLNGRVIYRHDGALRLADGTLAGADLTLDRAIPTAVAMGASEGEALAMASAAAADAIGATGVGRLGVGGRADFVHLGEGGRIRAFTAGQPAA